MKNKENEVPVQITVMQPTVINESKPVDIAYLWMVIGKQISDPAIMENAVTVLKKLVADLERAYADENTPGSGFFSTAEVDILISDLLTKAIQLVMERKISLNVAVRHIISPEKPVTTVGDIRHPLTRLEIDHFPVDFSDGMNPKLAEKIVHTSKGDFKVKGMPEFISPDEHMKSDNSIHVNNPELQDLKHDVKQYPMRPEECLNPEDVIDPPDQKEEKYIKGADPID